MFILMIIGTAFLCGINNVYVPYVISPHLGRWERKLFSYLRSVVLQKLMHCVCCSFLLKDCYDINPALWLFCRFNETFNFLFWTMFGVANQDYVDMPQFVLAEFVGRILYGIFTLVIVIVLLNMLIAMITNSFQKIEVKSQRSSVFLFCRR